MISIRCHFDGEDKLLDLMRYIENGPFVRVESDMVNLSEDTVENMKNTINSSRKRPDKGTHNLENSIDYEILINDPGRRILIGIANIDKMLKEAPYFEVIDAGGYVPPANVGYFPGNTPPVKGGSGENWTHTGPGKGNFYMKPGKAIEGIGYFGKAELYVKNNLDKIVNSIVEKYVNGMER